MKRIIGGILVALLLCSPVHTAAVPVISARSFVLMDADSGRVLCGSNEDEPRLIASTTKLMTALVAVESGHCLDEVVTIRPEWTGVEGSSLYLKAGEQLRLDTLLYGLLLRSGNDAAQAVAGYCSGDVSSFVKQMNERAIQLGMLHTTFTNPSGLDAPGHVSSARDLALLARACLKQETIRKIVSTKSITLENRILTNHNKLLWRYDGCIGLKTGYTQKAGRTLVSAAERDGLTLICVTLDAPNDWQNHTTLFDYGFAHYERRALARTDELICTLPTQNSLIPMCKVRAREDMFAAVTPEEAVSCELNIRRAIIDAPAEERTQVGSAVFMVNGQCVGEMELFLSHEVSRDAVEEHFSLTRFLGR